MLFSSVAFIFRFLIIFMVIYLICPQKLRNAVLLAGSLIFYGAGEPRFVFILVLSLCVNYLFYRIIRRTSSRLPLVLILVLNFALLFVYKYWDFAMHSLQQLGIFGKLPILSLALPLGISFYTFQIVSLQIDQFRALSQMRKEQDGSLPVAAQTALTALQYRMNFLDFATYIVMFPQLVAGPILQYREVAGEMQERKISLDQIEEGLKLFAFGLALKVLLANKIGTLWTTICSAGTQSLSVPIAWMGAFAYSFQI